ncbi:hypothetical protein DT019_21790 [Streptomyces sp. SDr-06]|nr:hypothetical protein DT019_21790 [Streptomyces sp. SDr-06]
MLPGVKTDRGEGDEWPEIRAAVLGADILILATPVWRGGAAVCRPSRNQGCGPHNGELRLRPIDPDHRVVTPPMTSPSS